jgi:hypothetical protein
MIAPDCVKEHDKLAGPLASRRLEIERRSVGQSQAFFSLIDGS